jgi:hypothetical protein
VTADSGLSAALLQLTQFGERIALLDDRESRNFRHIENTLAAMSGALATLKKAVDGQAAVLESLNGLGESVALLAVQVAELLPSAEDDPPPGYKPAPAIHWWSIGAEERQIAVALRAPGGHAGRLLGATSTVPGRSRLA